jgi:hypothetical protein
MGSAGLSQGIGFALGKPEFGDKAPLFARKEQTLYFPHSAR